MSTDSTPVQGEHPIAPWAPPNGGPDIQLTATSTQGPAPEAPGAPLPSSTVARPTVPADYGVTYCTGCGNPINPRAAVCVGCGVPTPLFGSQQRPANPKVKSTAIVLVVLFGVFGWLYTYQRDAWKFWLNLGLAVVTLGIWGLVAWVWAIIDMSVRPSQFYESFPNG